MENPNQTQPFPQAETYIEILKNLYPISKKALEALHNSKEQIQQTLEGFCCYDIKVAIYNYYKWTNDKIRPNLCQIEAKLSGKEILNDKQAKINYEKDQYLKFKEVRDNFDKQVKEYQQKFKYSKARDEVISQGADIFQTDKIMGNFIEIQAMILNPLPDNTFIGCGLESEFQRIKVNSYDSYEEMRFKNYSDYLRSRVFINKIKTRGVVSILIPDDIRDYLLNQTRS